MGMISHVASDRRHSTEYSSFLLRCDVPHDVPRHGLYHVNASVKNTVLMHKKKSPEATSKVMKAPR
jgi:hypothetical protein